MSYDPHESVEYIYKHAAEYAKAKGELAYLEAYKSSLKAILMKKSKEHTAAAQEREAYATEEYQILCKGIQEATEKVELLKWRMSAAQMRVDIWRTESSNNRQIDKATK